MRTLFSSQSFFVFLGDIFDWGYSVKIALTISIRIAVYVKHSYLYVYNNTILLHSFFPIKIKLSQWFVKLMLNFIEPQKQEEKRTTIIPFSSTIIVILELFNLWCCNITSSCMCVFVTFEILSSYLFVQIWNMSAVRKAYSLH